MFRGLKEGIPVHNAVTHIFRIRKPGNHSENALLLAEPEIGLKSHDVKKRALGVILSGAAQRQTVFCRRLRCILQDRRASAVRMQGSGRHVLP